MGFFFIRYRTWGISFFVVNRFFVVSGVVLFGEYFVENEFFDR